MKKAIMIAFLIIISATISNAQTYEVVRADKSLMCAYNSEVGQTDHDPASTASGTECHWGTVAANHLPLWTRIKIEGFGEKIFTVEDRHSPRYKKLVDIWFPDKKEAQKFGAKRLNYWVVKNVRPLI